MMRRAVFATLAYSFAIAASDAAEPVRSQAELEAIGQEYISDLAKLDPLFAKDCGQFFQTQATEIGRLYQKDGGLNESAPVSAEELEYIAVSWFAFDGAAHENIKTHPDWAISGKKQVIKGNQSQSFEIFSCDKKSKSPDGRVSQFDSFSCANDVNLSKAIVAKLASNCSAVARAMFGEEELPVNSRGYPDNFYAEASNQ